MPPFHLHRFADHESLSAHAADLIIDALRSRPELLLGVATGSTPTRTYQLVGERYRTEPGVFSSLRLFKIDEWGGLAPDDPATCETYVRQHLLTPLGVPPARYFGFRSDAADPRAECARVAEWLDRNGPLDLCILGIGLNGHLALNEPADALHPRPHVAELTESSLAHPMLRDARGEARYGLTMGMADILHSRRILLLVSGESKRGVLRRLLDENCVTPRFPASFLRLHRQVTILHDAAAGG